MKPLFYSDYLEGAHPRILEACGKPASSGQVDVLRGALAAL